MALVAGFGPVGVRILRVVQNGPQHDRVEATATYSEVDRAEAGARRISCALRGSQFPRRRRRWRSPSRAPIGGARSSAG